MSEKAKKILDLTIKIVTWVILAFTVVMMVFTVLTVTTVNKNERTIFGFRFYIVQSNSMSKSENNKDLDVHFKAGDIIIAKKVKDASKLEKGDIISFISANSDNYGETVTHMIYSVNKDAEGKIVDFTTFGTNTGHIDEVGVDPAFVLGKYAGKLPGLGNFFAFMKTTPGYITCILIPFLILILYNGINCIQIFKKYKKEQNAEIDAERAAIAAERQQTAEMLKELQALKAQLAKQAKAEASEKTEAQKNANASSEEAPSENS